ncbi:MAG: peptidoglycan-associated lipoprotein Pal [Gammaproteobacteria bacterium]
MKLIQAVSVCIFAAVCISGCQSTPEHDPSLLGVDASGARGAGGASTSGYGRGPGFSGNGLSGSGRGGYYNEDGSLAGSSDLNDPSSPLAKRVIYFMYDSSQVEDEFVPVINAHAQYLIAHPGQHVVLDGHADERGSREYNIALGEQRAQAVLRMLQMQGVGGEQMEIVSYGEEKPAVNGHDEESWHQNRRVELRYQGQ